MPAEDFADFTSGVRDATDSLGDFTDALGDAADASGDLGDLGGDLGGEGGGEAAGIARDVAGLGIKGATGQAGLRDIASVLLNIASAGLPPGVGTVLTKAVGSKL